MNLSHEDVCPNEPKEPSHSSSDESTSSTISNTSKTRKKNRQRKVPENRTEEKRDRSSSTDKGIFTEPPKGKKSKIIKTKSPHPNPECMEEN